MMVLIPILILYTLLGPVRMSVLSAAPLSIRLGLPSASFELLFSVDALALVLAITSLALVLLSWTRGEDHPHPVRQDAAMLLLATGLVGLAFAGNLRTGWLFLELCALAAVALLMLGGTLRALTAALGLVRWSALGTALAVAGLGLSVATDPADGGDLVRRLGFGLLVLGFGVKAGLFPMNAWVAAVGQAAPARVLALLTGAVPALTLVTLARVLAISEAASPVADVLRVLGILSALAGAFGMWRAQDFPSFLIQLSLASIGGVAVGFSLPGPAGLFSALALMLHFLLIQSALFVLAHRWRGRMTDLTAIAWRLPLTAAGLVLFAASLVGVPPLPGFWAKLMLVMSLAEHAGPNAMVVVLAYLLVTAVEAAAWLRLMRQCYARTETASPTLAAEMSPAAVRADRRPDLLRPGRWARTYNLLVAVLLLMATLMIAPVAEGLNRLAVPVAERLVQGDAPWANLSLPWPTEPIASVSFGWSWQALSPLDLMFLAALATLLLAVVFGRWRLFTPLFAAGYGVQFWALAHADVLTGQPLVASFALRILRQPVLWRYDSLSWFFAMLTIGAAFVCSLFALALAPASRAPASVSPGTESGAAPGIWHLFHVALALSVLSSLCLFGSGNLLALYVSWEVVLWSFFLLLAVGGGLALSAAIRYAAYSFAGGMALLGALALVFRAAGSFDFARVTASLPALGLGPDLLLGVLLLGALGLRLGALPLFAWQPGLARPPVPVFWHGIAARVGFFGLLLLLARMIGVDWLAQLGGQQWGDWLNPRILLCWLAVLLTLFGGWRARHQASAGGVLSWLALSQTGLVLLAVLLGGPFGTASGLLQLFSLGLAEAVLAGLCLVAAPMVTSQGRAAAGLRRLARGAALLAGASLVGLPPTLGFVSKWLLYDAILTDPVLGWSRWLLLTLVVLGSLLSLLGLVRLAAILRARAGDVCTCAARPYGVMAPVLGLSGLTLLAGVVPGPAMSWVAAMQQALGVPVLDWTLGGVDGRFDMLWLTLWQALLLLPLLALFWWLERKRSGHGEAARATLWRLVESVQGNRHQQQPGQRRLEPLLALAMDRLAGVAAALVNARLAPWTLIVTLTILVVWALGFSFSP